MFSHFRLQEFWGNSSLAALSTFATSDAKSIGRDCKCHYDAIFSILNIVDYDIVLLALLLLLVVVLMVVVEYILFLLLVTASVPASVLWCLVDLLVV